MWVGTAVGTRPMWLGDRADQRGDQHRVEAAAHLIGAPVGPAELRRLQTERVLDRDEVEQATLGGRARATSSTAAVKISVGRRRRVAPAGGMEPGAVERDGEVQRRGLVRELGHQAATVSSVAAVRRLVSTTSSALNDVKSVVSRKAGIEYRSRA